MPTIPERLETATTKVETDATKMHQIVHGGPTVVVTTEGGPVKSLAKAVNDLEESATASAAAALASKNAAATSETAAAGSASTANTKAGEAAASAAAALASQGAAAGSASSAASSASTAITKAGEAATSATEASEAAAVSVSAKDEAVSASNTASTLVMNAEMVPVMARVIASLLSSRGAYSGKGPREGIEYNFDKFCRQNLEMDDGLFLAGFTRDGPATRISKSTGLVESVAANVPRLNGRQELWKAGCKNLIQYSSDLTKTNWVKENGASISTSGAVFQFNTPNNSSYFYQDVTVASSGNHTFSLKLYRPSGTGVCNITIRTIGWTVLASTTCSLTTTQQTFSVTANLTAGTTYRLLVGGDANLTGAYLLVSDPQFELSGAATDYEPNPVVFQPGALLDGAATNYTPYSTGRTGWGSDNSPTVTENYTTAPDGTNTATRLVPDVTPVNDFYRFNSGIGAGNVVWSVWMKSASGTQNVTLTLFAINDGGVRFSSKVIVDTTWRRYFVSGNFSTLNNPLIIGFDNISGEIHYWGNDLKQGAIPSSYLPTSGASATRAADAATIDVSKIWNPQEGTVVVEADFGPLTGQYQNIIDASEANKGLSIYRNTSGVLMTELNAVSSIPWGVRTGRVRVAVAYKSGRWAVSVNGESVASQAVTNLIPFTTLLVGYFWWGSGCLNGTLQALQYLPYAVDDYTLKAASELS